MCKKFRINLDLKKRFTYFPAAGICRVPTFQTTLGWVSFVSLKGKMSNLGPEPGPAQKSAEIYKVSDSKKRFSILCFEFPKFDIHLNLFPIGWRKFFLMKKELNIAISRSISVVSISLHNRENKIGTQSESLKQSSQPFSRGIGTRTET